MSQFNNGYMYEKLSNTEAELKKVLLIKNKCVLEKSLTENFIFCAVLSLKEISNCYNLLGDFLRDFFFHFRVFPFYLFQNIRNYSVSRGRKRGILSRQKQPFADVLRNRCCNIYKKHRSRPATLLEKIPQQECFPVNITKFLRTAFL